MPSSFVSYSEKVKAAILYTATLNKICRVNNIIKQKMNVTRSLLEDIKTKQLKWYGHVQRMEEGRLPKKL